MTQGESRCTAVPKICWKEPEINYNATKRCTIYSYTHFGVIIHITPVKEDGVVILNGEKPLMACSQTGCELATNLVVHVMFIVIIYNPGLRNKRPCLQFFVSLTKTLN